MPLLKVETISKIDTPIFEVHLDIGIYSENDVDFKTAAKLFRKLADEIEIKSEFCEVRTQQEKEKL